jgi:hypothetical protein
LGRGFGEAIRFQKFITTYGFDEPSSGASRHLLPAGEGISLLNFDANQDPPSRHSREACFNRRRAVQAGGVMNSEADHPVPWSQTGECREPRITLKRPSFKRKLESGASAIH